MAEVQEIKEQIEQMLNQIAASPPHVPMSLDGCEDWVRDSLERKGYTVKSAKARVEYREGEPPEIIVDVFAIPQEIEIKFSIEDPYQG